jgi:hypothetical protein
MERREFVLAAALSGIGVAGLPACGRGGDVSPPQTFADTEPWNIVPAPALIVGFPAAEFDLKNSLPAGVHQGGRFTVSSAGRQLPTGVFLSPSGVLTLTVEANVGVAPEVVFAYEEPAP